MRTKINTYTKIPPSAEIKIEPFDVNKRYTRPHRHNKYLELVYFSKGTGSHYMDQTKYAIEPPIIFIVKKDEVHHWEIDTLPEGYVIIIKKDFLEKTLDKHINLQLHQLGTQRVIRPSMDPAIDGLFKIVSQETKENGPGQNIVVEGILKALFSKILGHAHNLDTSNLGKLTSQFTELMENQLKNDVSHYAALLNTTSQNLNTHCKKEYSKTASEVIAAQLLNEGKRLLRYTDLSVTEIAYSFDFKDVSHFVKYFKRYEGKTPLQFRKSAIIP